MKLFIPFDKRRIGEDVLEVTAFLSGSEVWAVAGCAGRYVLRVEKGSEAFPLTCLEHGIPSSAT
jgi:hypothetical protein